MPLHEIYHLPKRLLILTWPLFSLKDKTHKEKEKKIKKGRILILFQVVICTSQIYWTLEVHEAIRSGPHGLSEYYEKLSKQVC